MTPKKDMSEMEEISMQKVGECDNNEKKMYEPYTLQEWSYGPQ